MDQHQPPYDRQPDEPPRFHPAEPSAYPPEPPQKQSGLGIASFVIAIVCLAASIGLMLLAAAGMEDLLNQTGPIDMEEAQSIAASGSVIVAGLLMLATLGLSLVGLVLGIVGLVMKHRRKAFAIIGVILNGLLLLGFGALLLFSFTVQAGM
ncbi:hypothetical protein IDH44_23825 [Paenibacillus sp. IB182496]|uniref:DUF4064 domain-containing protein n=1 Tax=Paenibacillus sabuli TaxID=2772509 RepID=A0A927GUJ6_9BACL|nr:hypothetical protein [Paenibacillus sabuli]MBD2848235.1 hypothetical protein [Paenibacillus sabuli]